MRWGHDQEERQAVVKKAHDAYAAASASREEAKGAAARVTVVETELTEMRAALMEMRRTIGALSLRLRELETPRPVPKARKAA